MPAPAAAPAAAANAAEPVGGNNNNNNEGLGAVHQALLLREGPTGFQPFNKPKFFALRVRSPLFISTNSFITSKSGH